FVNMPYIPDAGSNCGMNFVNRGPSGALDGVTLAGGHEYAEVLTDQFPGGGWSDGYGLEAGDLCAWIPPGTGQGASANLTLTSGPFAVQSIWGNDFRGGVPGVGGCIMSHSIEVDGTPNNAPVITTWSSTTFSAGVPGTFTIAVTGFPVPTISATGLPGGVHLTDNHDGTATIAGISSASTGGLFAATISAANGIGGPVTQAFTLVVTPWSGTIVNFAGTVGATGNSGDGGPATAATLYSPSGEAFDGLGNLYIADFDNNRVRKVDPAGNITNFAGSADGSPGASGDGGPATAATLYGPAAVAVDAAGNVYIADRYNSRIRKVDTAGTISTVAGSTNGLGGNTGDGGPAIAARLNNPTALAMDGAGNLYIDDIGNNRVRRIDSVGMITNFAGDPGGASGNTGDGGPAVAATLSSPISLAVDAAGAVYIADLDNNRIRRVDPSGIITNFAGDPGGAVGDSGDFGAATAALLYRPNSVAVDRAGNVFIAEAADNRIKKVDTAGIIRPFAGGVNQLPDGGDEGPAILAQVVSPVALVTDASGDLFYADSNQRIRHIVLGPAITSRAATFTETIAETFTLPVASLPPATVTEAGILPRGISFNPATNTLSGTPAAGSAGTYPITFQATNGVGHDVTQAFTLTVNRAVMLSPRAGQAGFDTTQPFTWSLLAQAQAYLLTVGTTQYGTDVTVSGILPGSQTSYQGPSLPVGPTLYATVYAELNNTWIHYPSISFTAAPGQGALTYPLDSSFGCDPTHPITWATIPQAQGYEVSVSDGRGPGNIVNSGPLPPSQSSYTPKAWLPQDTVMTATLSTEVNGSFSRSQWITFACGPPRAAFIYPKNLQLNVPTPATFGWSPIWAAQHYIFVLGTKLNGTDVLVSGLLPPTQTTINVPALAHGKVYFASILTEVNGAWLYQAIGITAK
ncbi:MAG TPA: putative Ig domain-containing protein, partial [Acidimicrobiales bacterium]|nr:putative Ig domain-containing protein [Acidimicrobiales bacterium]